jgi:hypothetical protein
VTLEAASRAIQKLNLTPHQCEVLLDLQSSLQENKYAVCVCACVCVWCVSCVCVRVCGLGQITATAIGQTKGVRGADLNKELEECGVVEAGGCQ